MDYNTIIQNMNRKLFFKLNKIKVIPDEEGKDSQTVREYMGGFGFSHHYGGDKYPGQRDRANSIDVPDVSSLDTTYTTHTATSIKPDHPVKSREQKKSEDDREEKPVVDLVPEDEIQEQEAEVPPDAAAEPMPEEPMPEEAGADPEMADPGMGAEAGGDPGLGDPGLGDPMAGVPGQEETKDPTELGRTYEMKKIYARLVSMNEYLADEMSPKIVKTKRSLAKAIDLFAVIGANPDSYKEKIDEIIISYYKFLEASYKRVRAFYKSEAQKVGGIPLENNLEQNGKNKTEVKV